MTEQEENSLICEKLLGWKRLGGSEFKWDTVSTSEYLRYTPEFHDWESAGLILDAFAKHDVAYIVGSELKPNCFLEWSDHDVDEFGETAPLAIRAAALAYIQQVK